jgi:leucine dehydrogenase
MAFRQESFLELIEDWDGAGVVVRRDAPTGTWMFVAIHDDTLGMAAGGCRMKVYDRPEDGLRDALRLARGMTHKWAAMGLPFGGGKSVLAIPHPMVGAERVGLLHRFGELLNTLHGSYGTGEDLGTTPEDMAEIASVSPHVVQVHGFEGGPTDPGPFTALGVYEGIRAALEQLHGDGSVAGRSVLIQGVGDVGGPLARLVSQDGGQVLLSDLDQDKAFALSVEVGGSVVTPEHLYYTKCDVYAPCAIGATLNSETIPLLLCGAVAGSANNQLEEEQDAQRLHERGILYAPDYVINAGGALAFGLITLGERDTDELVRRVTEIGGSLSEMFADAAANDESPVHAAMRAVNRALERGSVT